MISNGLERRGRHITGGDTLKLGQSHFFLLK